MKIFSNIFLVSSSLNIIDDVHNEPKNGTGDLMNETEENWRVYEFDFELSSGMMESNVQRLTLCEN